MFKSPKVLKVIAGLGLLTTSLVTHALPVFGDANFVGVVVDGINSNPASEVTYINSLIQVGVGVYDPECNLAPTETCDRTNSTLAGPFSLAILAGAQKDETAPLEINANGFEYILGKYDADKAGTLVWYYAGGYTDGAIGLPPTFNGHGLSHISLYNSEGGPPITEIPEPATALLAGLALLGLAATRKRR